MKTKLIALALLTFFCCTAQMCQNGQPVPAGTPIEGISLGGYKTTSPLGTSYFGTVQLNPEIQK